MKKKSFVLVIHGKNTTYKAVNQTIRAQSRFNKKKRTQAYLLAYFFHRQTYFNLIIVSSLKNNFNNKKINIKSNMYKHLSPFENTLVDCESIEVI